MIHYFKSAATTALLLLGMFVLARAQSPAEIEANQIREKNAWIQSHPEDYRKIGGNPADASPNATPQTVNLAEKKEAPQLPPFSALISFKLVQTEVVVLDAQRADARYQDKELEGLKEDLPVGGTYLEYNSMSQMRLSNQNGLDLRGTETRNAAALTWFFKNESCESCSKTLHLTVESETSSQLVLLMQSEDEAAAVAYRLTFLTVTNR